MGKPDARSIALAVLDSVENSSRLATHALRQAQDRWDPKQRDGATATRLVLGTLRNRRLLDHFLGKLVKRSLPQKDRRLMNILRLAMYELLYMDSIPAYATLDGYAGLAKKIKGGKIASFVNAVLRSASNTARDELLAQAARLPPALRLSLPDWVAEQSAAAFGDRWPTELEYLNRPAQIAIRVNRAKTDRPTLCRQLEESGLHPTPVEYLADAILLPPNEPPYRTRQFSQGHFWPQDLASQLVTSLAGDGDGKLVLDACAGNGTKSFGMASAGVEGRVIVSADVSPAKLNSLTARCGHYGLSGISLVVADLLDPPFFRSTFDTVLVDAPCSGLGTMRRHPELRWRREPDDVTLNAANQLRMLSAAGSLVREAGVRGGRLVYCVCTFALAEGPEVVERFLADNNDFVLEDPCAGAAGPLRETLQELARANRRPWMRSGFLMTAPSVLNGDCFFAALMRRKHAK